jgi:hypothetical protein
VISRRERKGRKSIYQTLLKLQMSPKSYSEIFVADVSLGYGLPRDVLATIRHSLQWQMAGFTFLT